MKRYVIVGASARCYMMFVTRLVENYAGQAKITGVYDINKTRCKVFRDKIGDDCVIYDDFDKMLDEQRPDAVIVTTTDSVHHEYIVRSLDKGYDVISEKPLTNTYERCKEIRDAEKRSGHSVTVTFNCRFMPYFYELKKTIASGRIGKVLAINYEYCLTRWHGGDYFKRWHRLMSNSQGMLLHKSTHHFDIVNWLLNDEPQKVTALANRVYYNDETKRFGARCRDCSHKSVCESALSQTDALDKTLYFDAEKEDGYIRDRCCFDGSGDIYDNMSVSVAYNGGTLLTYTLNLFSEHEGYRMAITGEKGVIIAECWEHGYGVADKYNIVVLDRDYKTETITFDKANGTHAGGDDKLIAMIFGNETSDPLGQKADSYAGMVSAMIGIAANESIKTGRTVDVTEYLASLK